MKSSRRKPQLWEGVSRIPNAGRIPGSLEGDAAIHSCGAAKSANESKSRTRYRTELGLGFRLIEGGEKGSDLVVSAGG